MQTITYDPATHALVPREPTPAMLSAFYAEPSLGEGYAALLAAAPQSSGSMADTALSREKQG